ncbi:MAG: hypothetical protein A2Z96_04100 [Spirochaetes bacterium GWB1_48_6]|nr:MAG: hypothetical protein A2Z96_04100 [Spirochaetes bacterium GWB1_48_6]
MENPLIKTVKRSIFTRVPIDTLTEEQAEGIFQDMASDGRQHRIFLLTYKNYKKARRDEHFLKYIQESSLVIPVSKSLVWGMGFLNLPKPVLYHPFDFVIKLLSSMEEKSKTAYFIGGHHAEIQKIAHVVKTSFPRLRLVGRHVGFYPKEQEESVITAIQKAGPTVLVVGPGVPGKQKWLYKQSSNLTVPVAIWSDTVFAIMAGRKNRPSRDSVAKGTYEMGGIWFKPWKWLRSFSYLGYFMVLLYYKVRKLN